MKQAQDSSIIASIVDRVLSGDERAKGELIEATQDRLYKFCLLMSRNRELAEDLCQDTFIKSFQSLHHLKNPKMYVGWLYQIARNLLIDQKRKPSSKDEQTTEFTSQIGSPTNLDAMMSVQKVLSGFDPDERLLLLLIELEGYSYKEAGDMVGLSEDAVRSKLHRLKAAFIKKFNSDES